MYSVNVPEHGDNRMRKRMGINKSSTERIASKAFHLGLRADDVKGRLHKYMEEKTSDRAPGRYGVIYGNFLYIFEGNTLITVFPIPGNLVRHKHKKAS